MLTVLFRSLLRLQRDQDRALLLTVAIRLALRAWRGACEGYGVRDCQLDEPEVEGSDQEKEGGGRFDGAAD